MNWRILFFLILFIPLKAVLQPVTFGFNAGALVSNIETDFSQANVSKVIGYHAGVFIRFQGNPFYFQPEACFALRGGNMKYDYFGDQDTVLVTPLRISRQYFLKTIDVAPLIGLRLVRIPPGSNIRIFAGPSASFILNKEVRVKVNDEVKEIEQEIVDKSLSDALFGFRTGLGFDIMNLVLEASYEFGLSNFFELDQIYRPKDMGAFRSNAIKLSIGLKFL